MSSSRLKARAREGHVVIHRIDLVPTRLPQTEERFASGCWGAYVVHMSIKMSVFAAALSPKYRLEKIEVEEFVHGIAFACFDVTSYGRETAKGIIGDECFNGAPGA